LAGVVGGTVALAMLALPGLAQPQRGQPGAGRPERTDPAAVGQPMSAADLRARLQRRLEDARLIEQRLQQGIDSLDAGTPPEQVMRELLAPGLRRGRDAAPWRGGADRGPLTDQEFDRLLVVLRERMPRVAMWLEEERGRDPRLLEAVATRLAPQVREIERLRERDPEWARVRTEELTATIAVMRATRMYRSATGPDASGRSEALDTLRAALESQFDARLAARQHEVASLSRRLEALRQDIEAETAGRAQLIDAALERITQAADQDPAPQPAPSAEPPPRP
jgi:hypothetical protein